MSKGNRPSAGQDHARVLLSETRSLYFSELRVRPKINKFVKRFFTLFSDGNFQCCQCLFLLHHEENPCFNPDVSVATRICLNDKNLKDIVKHSFGVSWESLTCSNIYLTDLQEQWVISQVYPFPQKETCVCASFPGFIHALSWVRRSHTRVHNLSIWRPKCFLKAEQIQTKL